jgi:antitoxin MazE
MKVSVIKIGNSKGVRLPKSILEKYQIGEELELVEEPTQIVFRPIANPRKGWKEAFESVVLIQRNEELMSDVFDDENFEEWN